MKKRVAQQKRRVETYANRFRGSRLDRETYTIERILDTNTIQVKESENPLRLAGVKASGARVEEVFGEAPEGMSPAEWLYSQYGFKPGSRIRVEVEGDPQRRISRDTLRTQHAVLYAGGKNLNREFLQQGVAVEKENDWTDTGVAALFTGAQRFLGAMWETVAQADTFLNTKFLKVRTPLEELERGLVYGKRTGGWDDPIGDYVTPTLEAYAAKNPLVAGLATGAFASFFVRTGFKKQAFLAGAAAGAGLSSLRILSEQITGETWKPSRVRKREERESRP